MRDVTTVNPPALRHPRRFGFIIFNVVALLVMGAWLLIRWDSTDAGLAGLPTLALTTAGVVVLALVWIGSWIAWGAMVWSRHRRHKQA
jgi:hypothetical protein